MTAGTPLDALERAAGVVLGAEAPPDAPGRAGRSSARHAIEAVVARELESAPCVVSFSGGRDSSAVLAVATLVARREGLAPPVPVTFRFPDLPETQEVAWQERVITHLGLNDWQRIDLTDELDLLGPTARDCLSRHGSTWPPNAYLHMPIFERARGGVVLTGLDGDGLFGDWRWCHAQGVLHRRSPFKVRDVARVGLAFSPVALRLRSLRRRPIFVPDWLTAPAQESFARRILERAAEEPRRWDHRVRWHARSRALGVTTRSLATLAAPLDVRVAHPLLDPTVIDAMATEGGAAGYGDRTAAMRHLFGDLLPEETLTRRSKAVFGAAVWRAEARAFVESWDGMGVDTDLVVPERLRQAWRHERPVFHSWTLLHNAWMSTQAK